MSDELSVMSAKAVLLREHQSAIFLTRNSGQTVQKRQTDNVTTPSKIRDLTL
jgi:hypothetical protein